jgi:hypothetical protein
LPPEKNGADFAKNPSPSLRNGLATLDYRLAHADPTAQYLCMQRVILCPGTTILKPFDNIGVSVKLIEQDNKNRPAKTRTQ